MIIQICGGALIIVFSAVVIKQFKPELALPVTAAGSVIFLVTIIARFAPQVEFIDGLWIAEGLRGYAAPLVKSLGIALIAQTASDICKDMGENSAASKVELAGKAEIMLLCLPLINELLGFARELLLG